MASMKCCQKTITVPKGFTLMEIMVAVGILSIVAAIAFPLIHRTFPKYRLRAAARELVINFKKAKVEAVKEHRNVIIRFATGSYSTCVDANDNDTCDAGETTQTVSLPKDVQLDIPTSFTNDTTGYDDRGLLWNNQFGTLDITLADGSRKYTISMASSGGISIR